MRSDELEAFCRAALNEPGLSNLQCFGIVSGSVLVYMVFAGIAQRMSGYSTSGDGPFGLLWPFVLPWMLGMRIVELFSRTNLPRATATERK